jgi:hypothetical protein
MTLHRAATGALAVLLLLLWTTAGPVAQSTNRIAPLQLNVPSPDLQQHNAYKRALRDVGWEMDSECFKKMWTRINGSVDDCLCGANSDIAEPQQRLKFVGAPYGVQARFPAFIKVTEGQ